MPRLIGERFALKPLNFDPLSIDFGRLFVSDLLSYFQTGNTTWKLVGFDSTPLTCEVGWSWFQPR